MSKLNVWLVNQHAVQPSQGGGTRHFDIARALKERGHRVTVWASSRNHGTGQEVRDHRGFEPVVEEVDGVTWVWVRTTPYFGNGVKRVINMLSFFVVFLYSALLSTRGRLSKPDVIVGSSVHPLAPCATWVLSKLWGLPPVTEIRDIWPAALVDLGVPKYHPIIIVFSLIERFLYKFSTSVVTLLPTSPAHIAALGCPREHIFWVPNGTDLPLLPAEPRESEVLTARYLGTLGDGYALENVVEAGAILEKQGAPVEILLQGRGPAEKRLRQMVEQLGLQRVRILPAIPKTEVSQTLRSSDALIFHLPPSPAYRWGISSNKLFDYLGSGRPVLFCCQAANNPVEESGAGFTVPPMNPEKLAEALIEVQKLSAEERLKMGREGQRFIRENHTIEALAIRFEEALQDTVRRGSSRYSEQS